jgi:hypothetical protein
MKTFKNKLTAAAFVAFGIRSALACEGVAALLAFIVFAIPAAVLFLLPYSIFTFDHAEERDEKWKY